MAARVPDGRRVVLGAEREDEFAAAEPRVEGGGQVGDAGGDLEIVSTQHLDDLRGAPVFLERKFRFGVDGMRQADEGVGSSSIAAA